MHGPHPMISHVSNAAVSHQAQARPLSETLEAKQLIYFGRVAALPHDSVLRACLLANDGTYPKPFEGRRRRGRPRVTWAHTQHAKALQLCGSRLLWTISLLVTTQT